MNLPISQIEIYAQVVPFLRLHHKYENFHHNNLYSRCSLQGCVVCSHARLEDRVSLKDCYIGANFTITKEGTCMYVCCYGDLISHTLLADMRGETLVVGGGLHF